MYVIFFFFNSATRCAKHVSLYARDNFSMRILNIYKKNFQVVEATIIFPRSLFRCLYLFVLFTLSTRPIRSNDVRVYVSILPVLGRHLRQISPYGVRRPVVLVNEVPYGHYVDYRFVLQFHHELDISAVFQHPVQPRQRPHDFTVLGRMRRDGQEHVDVRVVLVKQVFRHLRVLRHVHEEHDPNVTGKVAPPLAQTGPQHVALVDLFGRRVHQDQQFHQLIGANVRRAFFQTVVREHMKRPQDGRI